MPTPTCVDGPGAAQAASHTHPNAGKDVAFAWAKSIPKSCSRHMAISLRHPLPITLTIQYDAGCCGCVLTHFLLEIMGHVDFVKSVAIEIWILYSAGALLILLRLCAPLPPPFACPLLTYDSFARLHTSSGLSGLKVDDYVVAIGFIAYTLLAVSLNKVAGYGGSNYMTPDQIAALTPETTKKRVLGSKWAFIMTHFMLVTVWSMKCCMIILYLRIR